MVINPAKSVKPKSSDTHGNAELAVERRASVETLHGTSSRLGEDKVQSPSKGGIRLHDFYRGRRFADSYHSDFYHRGFLGCCSRPCGPDERPALCLRGGDPARRRGLDWWFLIASLASN